MYVGAQAESNMARSGGRTEVLPEPSSPRISCQAWACRRRRNECIMAFQSRGDAAGERTHACRRETGGLTSQCHRRSGLGCSGVPQLSTWHWTVRTAYLCPTAGPAGRSRCCWVRWSPLRSWCAEVELDARPSAAALLIPVSVNTCSRSHTDPAASQAVRPSRPPRPRTGIPGALCSSPGSEYDETQCPDSMITSANTRINRAWNTHHLENIAPQSGKACCSTRTAQNMPRITEFIHEPTTTHRHSKEATEALAQHVLASFLRQPWTRSIHISRVRCCACSPHFWYIPAAAPVY